MPCMVPPRVKNTGRCLASLSCAFKFTCVIPGTPDTQVPNRAWTAASVGGKNNERPRMPCPGLSDMDTFLWRTGFSGCNILPLMSASFCSNSGVSPVVFPSSPSSSSSSVPPGAFFSPSPSSSPSLPSSSHPSSSSSFSSSSSSSSRLSLWCTWYTSECVSSGALMESRWFWRTTSALVTLTMVT